MTDRDLDRVEGLISQLLEEHPPAETPETAFGGAQYDLGLAWVARAEGEGGLGLSPRPGRASTTGPATSWGSAWAPRCWPPTEHPSRSSAGCDRCSRPRRSGVRCSPSRVPGPTSPAWRRWR